MLRTFVRGRPRKFIAKEPLFNTYYRFGSQKMTLTLLFRGRGFGLIGLLIAVPVAFVVLLIVVIAFYEIRKTYWDGKVRELCAKDGGAVVFEKVILEKKIDGNTVGKSRATAFPIGAEDSYSAYFSRTTMEKLRESDPEIYRLVYSIFRRADGKLLSTQIQYGRIGGDFPSIAHPSSFGCKNLGMSLDVEKQTFQVKGN